MLRERAIERQARGRAFGDAAFWNAYIAAVNARRAAVDRYEKENPEMTTEAESEPMFR